MKNLIDYYESILDEPDFDQVVKDVEKFKEQQIVSMVANALNDVSYNKNKNLLKIDRDPFRINFVDGTFRIISYANGTRGNNDYVHRPFEDIKKYNIKLDANIEIGAQALQNGFKLSDLNFVGKNRYIRMGLLYNKSMDDHTKYKLVKSFFDTSFDPTNILMIYDFERWSEYLLEDPLVSKFAAVRTYITDHPADLNDLHDCQAKVLMVDDCENWAKLKTGVKSYKEYFENTFRPLYKKPDAVLTYNNTDPSDVFRFFLLSNPKTKLLARLGWTRGFESCEYIYLKDNKIVVDTIKGPSPWKKI